MAILAAYALVLQAVTVGLTTGALASAATPMVDAFGVVICTADASGEHGSSSQAPQSHADPACLAACALSVPVGLSPPAGAGLAAPARRTAVVPPFPPPVHPAPTTVSGPFGPRGPPLEI